MREAGYVYVLENESMPGVFKVGFTTRDLDRHPFEVVAALNEVTCDELRPALGRVASRSLRLRVVE
jgi:hypothetical protein